MSVLAFALLSVIAGLGARRALAGVAAVAILAVGVVVVLIAVNGSAVIARQEALLSSRVEQGQAWKPKKQNIHRRQAVGSQQDPTTLTHAPFGLGLGTGASAGGLGGHEKLTIEEEKIPAASTYNLLAVEVGLPGLLLWIGLTLSVIALGVSRLRRVADRELRIYLVAMLTTFIAFTIQGLSGPTVAVTPAGAYLWFAPGVLAYWLAGPGCAAMHAGSSSRAVRRSLSSGRARSPGRSHESPAAARARRSGGSGASPGLRSLRRTGTRPRRCRSGTAEPADRRGERRLMAPRDHLGPHRFTEAAIMAVIAETAVAITGTATSTTRVSSRVALVRRYAVRDRASVRVGLA